MEEVSPPPATISEHQVLLGTAAALAVAPSFQGELDSQEAGVDAVGADAERLAVPRRSGWIAALARRIKTSDGWRSRRPYYPSPLELEFITDARMDREMYRL